MRCRELAWTVTDLLARRTRIAWSSCQGLDALSTVTALMARYGKLPPARVKAQAEEYQAYLARGLAFRRDHAAVEPVLESPTVTAGGQDHDD